jgi:hypothetical protein
MDAAARRVANKVLRPAWHLSATIGAFTTNIFEPREYLFAGLAWSPEISAADVVENVISPAPGHVLQIQQQRGLGGSRRGILLPFFSAGIVSG